MYYSQFGASKSAVLVFWARFWSSCAEKLDAAIRPHAQQKTIVKNIKLICMTNIVIYNAFKNRLLLQCVLKHVLFILCLWSLRCAHNFQTYSNLYDVYYSQFGVSKSAVLVFWARFWSSCAEKLDAAIRPYAQKKKMWKISVWCLWSILSYMMRKKKKIVR